ncbi:MAG: hypothetical protein ACI8Z1_002597 [Candidatus Azotimanducaceae bacterium]|jgi:hypothetical protein
MNGYSRGEFPGRNCRFYQRADTHRDDARLIREALETDQSINLLLCNYRGWKPFSERPLPLSGDVVVR